MKEPHKPPSKKELKESGTADWVQKAMDNHEQRQQKLGSIFNEAQKDIRMEKDALSHVWNQPVGEEVDKGPDLFAAERSKNAAENKKLASVWDQDRADREAEQAQLRNMFGAPPPGGNKKRR